MNNILVSQRLMVEERSQERREALASSWGDFLSKTGIIPIPVLTTVEAQAYFKALPLSGLLLTGGNDLSTLVDTELNRQRDRLEKCLLELAIKERLPVIGVCRGMQFLADYFGLAVKPVSGHVAVRHFVELCSDSQEKKEVNSFHNFGLLECGRDFECIARAADGTIEAMSHRRLQIHGIMWHPEREGEPAASDLALFKRTFVR